MTTLVGGDLARCPPLQSRLIHRMAFSNTSQNGEDDMILTKTPMFEIQVDPWQAGSGEGCRWLIAEAEREITAFFTAAREIFGSAAAVRAAEYWIELAETVSLHAVEGRPNWRKLTIMASCRLAADSIFAGESAEDEVGRRHRRTTVVTGAGC
jgi:hypothetical protein